MRRFTDSKGREWSIEICTFDIKRVRSKVGVDLPDLVDEGQGFKGIAELMEDTVRLVDVVWTLCESDATERGVSPEDFSRGLVGDAIERAAEAFAGAIADFSRSRGVRAALAKITDAWTRTRDRMDAEIVEKIEKLDLVAEVERKLGGPGASSTSSPASSASTRRRSR